MPNTLKWRDDPVYDLEGVTRDLEQLQTILLAGTLKGETLKGALTGELPEPALAKPEAWKKLTTLGYKNSWADEAATPGEYRKTPFGTVELRGTIKGGESGKEAFTLPAGYRPTKAEELGVLASLRNIAELNVATTGVTIPFNGPTSEVKTYCTLHASFSVE